MSGSDDSILARLVELDQKASAMVEEAREVLDDTVSHIEQDTEQFRQKAIRRISIAKDEEVKASQAELENISRRYQSLAEGLEKTYRERHTQWEDEIFRRCVGK